MMSGKILSGRIWSCDIAYIDWFNIRKEYGPPDDAGGPIHDAESAVWG